MGTRKSFQDSFKGKVHGCNFSPDSSGFLRVAGAYGQVPAEKFFFGIRQKEKGPVETEAFSSRDSKENNREYLVQGESRMNIPVDSQQGLKIFNPPEKFRFFSHGVEVIVAVNGGCLDPWYDPGHTVSQVMKGGPVMMDGTEKIRAGCFMLKEKFVTPSSNRFASLQKEFP